MHKVIRVNVKEMFPVVKEILNNNGVARITVTGMSMYPFLRHGIDSIELSHPEFSSVCRGDIVLIENDCNQYILHRVFKKKTTGFYIVGDAQQLVEGPILPYQLVATVSAVWRREKRITCSSFWWQQFSRLWLLLLPFRYLLIRGYRKFKGLHNFF